MSAESLTMCSSCWLRWQLLTTLTQCPRSQQPYGHHASVVNDHADTRFFAKIFAKTKTFAKPFLPVHMGPWWSFLIYKKCRISRDTFWQILVLRIVHPEFQFPTLSFRICFRNYFYKCVLHSTVKIFSNVTL